MSFKLIGFYPTDDQAEHARDDLRNAGFNGKDIHLYRGGREPGLLESAGAVDRKLYQEASRRGATAVTLDLDETRAADQRALQILRRHNPIEMARATWRSQGWQGSMQPQRRQPQPQPQPQQRPVEKPVIVKQAKVVEEAGVKKDVRDMAQSAPDNAPPADVDVPRAQAQHEPEVIFSAKRFATEMAGDERFRGREWSDIEIYVRREFERRYPNESWDDHCAAILLGYTRATEAQAH
jgi:hypothetical protein